MTFAGGDRTSHTCSTYALADVVIPVVDRCHPASVHFSEHDKTGQHVPSLLQRPLHSASWDSSITSSPNVPGPDWACQATGSAVVGVGLALPPIHGVDARLKFLRMSRPGAARPTACRCLAIDHRPRRCPGGVAAGWPSPRRRLRPTRVPTRWASPLSTSTASRCPREFVAAVPVARSSGGASSGSRHHHGTVFQNPRGKPLSPGPPSTALVDDPSPSQLAWAVPTSFIWSAASICQVSCGRSARWPGPPRRRPAEPVQPGLGEGPLDRPLAGRVGRDTARRGSPG